MDVWHQGQRGGALCNFHSFFFFVNWKVLQKVKSIQNSFLKIFPMQILEVYNYWPQAQNMWITLKHRLMTMVCKDGHSDSFVRVDEHIHNAG